VTMEATQLWCIACQEPAYLLSPFGYCGECPVLCQAAVSAL
jgi:hypothetical protein